MQAEVDSLACTHRSVRNHQEIKSLASCCHEFQKLTSWRRHIRSLCVTNQAMPSFVLVEKCDGCKGQDKTACQYICPHDLMVLNIATRKAYNRDPQMCWECYNCVKICPQQAIDVRGYADFIPLGASVVPLRGSEDIIWTVKFRNGIIKRFKFPIRTTPEGTADPSGGFSEGSGDLKSTELMTEPASLGCAVPTFRKIR